MLSSRIYYDLPRGVSLRSVSPLDLQVLDTHNLLDDPATDNTRLFSVLGSGAVSVLAWKGLDTTPVAHTAVS